MLRKITKTSLTELSDDTIFEFAPRIEILDLSYNQFSTLKCIQWFAQSLQTVL